MKLKRRIAAIAVAMTMAVSSMIINASAAENATDYPPSDQTQYVQVRIYPTLKNNIAETYTIATNLTGSGKYMLSQANINIMKYENIINVATDRVAKQVYNSGTTTNVSSGIVSLTYNSLYYAYGSVAIHNGASPYTPYLSGTSVHSLFY